MLSFVSLAGRVADPRRWCPDVARMVGRGPVAAPCGALYAEAALGWHVGCTERIDVMKATLAPNGRNRYESTGSCAWLLVGTADGLVTLERTGAPATWAVTTRALEGQHISSLLIEPRQGGIFAGAHSGGLYASLDGGQSWVPRMRGLSPEHVFTLASVECDGRVLLYAGTQPAHLFVSE